MQLLIVSLAECQQLPKTINERGLTLMTKICLHLVALHIAP